MNAGIAAAFKEVNAKGGVHGRSLELIAKDDGYEPDRCVENTFALIDEDQVFALTGYVGTPTAKAAVPVVTELGVPLVGLFTGAGFLRQPVQREIFNVRASYDQETEALVERMVTDLGVKKIAVFHQNDSFGAVGLSGTTKALDKRGMAVAGTGTYERNTTDIAAGLKAIKASGADGVVMVGAYAPLAAFIKAAKAEGLNIPFATISFTGTEAIIGELGDAAEGLIISQVVPSPTADLPVIKACTAALAANGDNTPTFGKVEGYITAKVLIAGLEAAGKDVDRDGLISALESINDQDLGGLKVSLSPTNHQAIGEVYITQVKGGVAMQVSNVAAP
jgi:ABC-type branched-subunit amino acid transport system substrate-binding protein